MSETQQLLAEYVEHGSETAFRELVNRYVDLVHSAAFRLVDGDVHLAQDVSQTVFIDLARMARSLSRDVMLGGWLHRHTCFVASKIIRTHRRRQERERKAVELNAMHDHSSANFEEVAPILDDAINRLGAEDRKAIMLRFFEQRDFRSVGEALASNEEAARKRVNRALGKLHLLLTRRGVTLSTAALGTVLGASAVSAAPAGMAAGIATAALNAATVGVPLTVTILNIMSMTKAKIAVASVIVVAAATVPFVLQQNANSKLRQENAALRQQVAQIDQLTAENERLSKLAMARATPPPTNDPSRELLKLRGEVGRLRQENATVNAAIAEPKGPSALSGITADPEMYKILRDQQKIGLAAAYKDFAKRASMPSEQNDKLVDLLADNVMENVEHIQTLLRDHKSLAESESVFAAQEASFQERVQALLGPEGLAQFQDYTRNLLSHVTTEQFKAVMTADKSAKDEQAGKLLQLMKSETQRALEAAGLPADHQLVPTLNFRNIAFEQEAEKNLQMLDAIYRRVGEQAAAFLNAEDAKKFDQFRDSAITGNRMALTVNRKVMLPTPK